MTITDNELLKDDEKTEDKDKLKKNLTSEVNGQTKGKLTYIGNKKEMDEIRDQEIELIKEIHEFCSSQIPPKLEVELNGENIKDWLFKLESKLQYYQLEQFMYGFKSDLKDNKLYKRYNMIVRNVILNSISPRLRDKFINIDEAKELVNQIKIHFQGNDQVQSIKLFGKIADLMINKPVNLEFLVSELKTTMDRFNELYKDNITEIWKCIFLNCLNQKHNQLRSVLIAKEYTIEEFFSICIREQQLFNSNKPIKMNSNIMNKSKSNSNYTCFECDKNHLLKDCQIYKNKVKANPDYKPKRLIEFLARKSRKLANVNKTKQKSEVKSNENEASTSTDLAMNCTIMNRINGIIKSSKIYLDSGATDHMFNSVNQCYNFKENRSKVFTASGDECEVTGTANLDLITSQNFKLRLNNVVICEGLCANFLSIPKLDEYGFVSVFKNNKAHIYHKNRLIMVAVLQDSTNLYEVQLKEPSKINLVVNQNVINWHKRLGHMNLNDLNKLKNNLNLKLDLGDKLNCEICNLTKMHRLSHNSSISDKADSPGDVVHMDLSGKIRIFNRDRKCYFLLLVDVFSRFTHVFLLNSKDQVFNAIEMYVKMIKAKFNKSIRILHSDNGTEFKNKEVTELCQKYGVQQSFTTISCPQQNGIVERLNRVVAEMARAMLMDAKLHPSFWTHAVNYAIHIKNRIPHSGINGQIPFELFNNEVVDYNRIKLFGSKVYYLLEDKERKNKFDQCAKSGIYIGTSSNSSGHLIYDFEKRCVITRFHVKFTEEFYNKSSNESIDDELDQFCDNNYKNQQGLSEEDVQFFNMRNLREKSNGNQQLNVNAEQNVESQDFVQETFELVESDDDSSGSINYETGSEDLDKILVENEESNEIQQVNEQFKNVKSGQLLELNKKSKSLVEKLNPDRKLTYVRPVNRKGNGKNGIYKVNAVAVPRNFNQLNKIQQDDLGKWNEAMKAEIKSMIDNNVYELVERPKNCQVLPTMWVYRVKFDKQGQIEKYKARLVILGNKQFDDSSKSNYSPVINDLSLRTLLVFGAKYKMNIHHMDVCTAYLHSKLDQPVYVQQPKGFSEGKTLVWKLLKSVYGLRVSAVNWYNTITSILVSMGFRRSYVDNCVFIKREEKRLCIIGIYVDDVLLVCNQLKMLNEIKIELAEKVSISDKGTIEQFLNLEINYNQEKGFITIAQENYIQQLLSDFNMSDCKIKKTPVAVGAVLFESLGEKLQDKSLFLSALGRLIYLSVKGRYDIMYIVGRLCSHMHSPTEYDWSLVKHVMRYLKFTKNYKVHYIPEGEDIKIFTDADFGNGDKSITGLCTLLFNCLVNCSSKKQSTVATSTTQAETNALAEAFYDLVYVCDLTKDFDESLILKKTVFNDNQSALAAIESGGDFGRNRHYRSKINFIKDVIRREGVNLEYVESELNVADVFTKPTSNARLSKILDLLNIKS